MSRGQRWTEAGAPRPQACRLNHLIWANLEDMGYVARLYARHDGPEPVGCREDEWVRQKYACEVWYSDERPDD